MHNDIIQIIVNTVLEVVHEFGILPNVNLSALNASMSSLVSEVEDVFIPLLPLLIVVASLCVHLCACQFMATIVTNL